MRRIFEARGAVDPDLDALREDGFFIPWDQLQREELAFKHPLLQEVAYEGQLLEQRRTRHASVARAIEESGVRTAEVRA